MGLQRGQSWTLLARLAHVDERTRHCQVAASSGLRLHVLRMQRLSLLVDAAEKGKGHCKTPIPHEEARLSYEQVGTPEKEWLAFQPYLNEILARSNGSFLK